MAVFIIGKSSCSLCERVIAEGEEIVSFSPFVANELDPLWIFSDGVFHANCFYREPLAHKAQSRYRELQQKSGPGNRVCVVCKKEIKEPGDYFTLGHLTENEDHPLYGYNYTQAHRSCLSKWPELPQVHAEIEALNESGEWGGKALDRLLSDLTHYLYLLQQSEQEEQGKVG